MFEGGKGWGGEIEVGGTDGRREKGGVRRKKRDSARVHNEDLDFASAKWREQK